MEFPLLRKGQIGIVLLKEEEGQPISPAENLEKKSEKSIFYHSPPRTEWFACLSKMAPPHQNCGILHASP